MLIRVDVSIKKILPNHYFMKSIFFIFIFVSWFVVSCSNVATYEYPNDDHLTNVNGTPKKRGLSYFPTSWFIDSTMQNSMNSEIDSSNLKLFSKALFKVGEPILYNNYIGKPVIRLTWMRPNRPFLILSLEDIENKLYLKENGFESVDEKVKTKQGKDSVIAEKRIYQRKPIDYQNMVKIRQLIKKNKVNEMSPTIYQSSCMGAKFVLEIHEPTNYHLVFRCVSNETEETAFRELCDFIIDLSKYKDEPRY
jgi:hypothetical protein